MGSGELLNIKAFIDNHRMSSYQWLVLVLCFLIVMMDGLDTAIVGFVAPVVMHDWNVSRAAFGPIMSAAMVGLAVGALVAGPTADRIGRKKVLIGSVFLFGFFCLLCAYATTPTELVILRFLTGLGLGAAMPNSTTLLSEYVPSRNRSLLLTIMFSGFNLGSGAGGFVAAAIIPHFGWRGVLIVVGVLPLLLVPVLIWLLPESARFLLVRNAPMARIGATLSRVCRFRFAPETHFTSPEPTLATKVPVKALFTDGYATSTLLLWLTYFMGLLVIYLLTSWLPTLIRDTGLSVEQAAVITGMFQLGGVVGSIAVGFIMDRMERNTVISTSYILGAFFVFSLGLATLQPSLLIVLVTCVGIFMSGSQTGLNALAPACYPTRARATGVSWMLGIGRLGGILGSLIGGVLLSQGFSYVTVFSILAVPALIAACTIAMNRLARRRITAPVTDI